jgi:hypothetical protein
MRLSLLLAPLLTTTALAAPWGPHNWFGRGSGSGKAPFTSCLTKSQADAGAEIFRQLIQNYTSTLALTALTEDFVDYSSAVNLIRNKGNEGPIKVNGVSFDGRPQFMAAQGSQPQIPFDTLNVFWGCDHVAMRWQTLRSANGQKTEKSKIVSLAIITFPPPSSKTREYDILTLNLSSPSSATPSSTPSPTPQTSTASASARCTRSSTPVRGC